MPARLRWGAGALVAAIVTVVVGARSVVHAGAQATTCTQGAGLSPAQIQIDAPGPNETVSGTVAVRGTARVTLVGQLSRVEVSLGSVSKAQTFEPGSVLNFNVSLDSSSLPTGSTNLTVTTCGLLAWAEKSVGVNVAAAPAVTTTLRATTTTVAGPGPTVVATSTPGTSVVALPVQAGGSTSTRVSTTVTTAPPTTETPAAAATTTTVATRPAGRDTPLVLTETPPKSSSGPPVWVGAVVGISGGLGLLFSARPWRRRTGLADADAAAADSAAAELADEDLVSTK